MDGQTDNLYKKWIVYNTVLNSNSGWHTFSDSYILDFSDRNNLIIKTLGDNEILIVPYSFNSENGIIYEDNGEILYCVYKVSSDRLILNIGENSSTTINLRAVDDQKHFDINFTNILKNKKWAKDCNSLEFTDENYLIAGEVQTNFKTLIEKDEALGLQSNGAWLVDSYEGLIFLELYSERFKLKTIYQIEFVSNKYIRAKSTDKQGQLLVMELFGQ